MQTRIFHDESVMETKIKTGFTTYTHLSFVFLTFFFSVGCTLSYNITDLDQKYNSNTSSENDKTAPILSGTIIDGVSYGSLSTTPNLLWPDISEAKNGLDYYELALGSSAGGEEVLSWTKIGSTTNHAHSGLNLTKGRTYYPKIRAVDAYGNKSAAIFGDGWIATTLLSFLQPTYSLITGESITLGLTGGETPYTFQNSVSGYLNTTSGVYAAPLNIIPTSEQVSAVDRVSQPAQTTINIRAFEDKDIFRSNVYQPVYANLPNSITSDPGNILYASGGSYYDATSTLRGIIKKSVDGGTSWSVINEYQYATNKTTGYGKILVVSASELYILASASDSSNINHWVVRKSTDSGSSWTTVDDYTNGTTTAATSIAMNSSGHIFVAGFANLKWVVRKSSDSGATWNNVDVFDYLNAGISSSAYSIKIDNTGNIYVAGNGFNASYISYWLVRKSTDNGVSWTTIDTFQQFSGYSSVSDGIEISGTSLFSVGHSFDSSGKIYWVTRRSSDAGASWTTVDAFQLIAGYNSVPNKIFSPTTSVIYSVGYGKDSSNKSHWVVRKSSDNGNTWNTSDNFIPSAISIQTANAIAITADNLGNLYASGTGQVNSISDSDHWFTRKSTDSGVTWATVEDYSYSKQGDNRIASLAYDSTNKILYSAGIEGATSYPKWIVKKSINNGSSWTTIDSYQVDKYNKSIPYKVVIKGNDIYVVGGGVDSSCILGHWIVRKSSDGGNSWTNIDDWAPYPNTGTTAKSIAFDSSGNIYVGGYIVDTSFYQRWVVRKSSNNGVSWTVIDNFAPNYVNILNDIIVTATNEIIATGSYMNPSSQMAWLTRKSSDGGSTWTNVDTYQMTNTKTSVASKFFVSSTNDLYVTGYGLDASNINHSLLRKSSDNGVTWNTIYNYQLTPTKDSLGVDFTIDSNNYFYMLTNAKDTSNINHIVIQKSTDSGVSWVTIDNYSSLDTSKTHSAGTIIPCFTNQICIGGSRSVDADPINQGIVRILSAEP